VRDGFSAVEVVTDPVKGLGLRFRRSRVATGVTATVQMSPSLENGTWTNVNTTPEETQLDDDTDEVTVYAPAPGPGQKQQFLRLRVSQP
jgi:hypothetical protein